MNQDTLKVLLQETVAEAAEDIEALGRLGKARQLPVPPPFPPLAFQVDQLVDRFGLGKLVILYLGAPAQLPEELLDEVGALQVAPQGLGVVVEPEQGPRVVTPRRGKAGVTILPRSGEAPQRFQGLGSTGCPVEPLEVCEHGRSVPALDLGLGGPELVQDRVLPSGPGVDLVDHLLNSRKTAGNEEQYVYETAGPEFLQQPLPDEGSFVWEKPKPQENAPSVFGRPKAA